MNRLVALITLVLALLSSSSAVSAQQVTMVQGTCFGPISWKVTIGQPLDDAAAERLMQQVQQRLDEINQRMSTYRDDSDVTRFNRSESTDWFPVDPETATVVQQAQEISAQTHGAFDITVGPLVLLWKFGPAAADQLSLPSDQEVQAALENVGYQKLQVQLEPAALKKDRPALQIDLSAIAKGYAVDQVAEVAQSLGYRSFFVEVGEEVRAAGRHPANRSWICGIEKPLEDRRVMDLRVPVDDAAIATSGDYRQFHKVDGKRLSHTIDPRSGRPSQANVALASVQAANCMQADAWATALMVLGWQATEDLPAARQLGIHMVLRQDGEDAAETLVTRSNDRYPAAIQPIKVAQRNWMLPVGISILIFGIAIVSMSVGVIFKRQPIKGSCGGLANMPGSEGSACELCSNPSKECRELGRGAKKKMEEAAAAEKQT